MTDETPTPTPVDSSQPAQDAPSAPERLCLACGRAIPPEPARKGPARRYHLECSGSAAYQREWLRKHAEYRGEHAAIRRVTHEPRTCEGCERVFVPARSDARYCCKPCGYATRTYGKRSPEGQAAHRATHTTPRGGHVTTEADAATSTRRSAIHTHDGTDTTAGER